jgi:VanZ family protein
VTETAQPAIHRIRAWLPAVAWAILISLASSDTFSAVHTSHLIVPILHFLFPGADPETVERLHFLVRKSAHFTEYFIFSVLLFRAVRSGRAGWQFRWTVIALLIAAGYSALDEFHQSFVPSRTASPWDSLLDTIGATAGQIVVWAWSRFTARRL